MEKPCCEGVTYHPIYRISQTIQGWASGNKNWKYFMYTLNDMFPTKMIFSVDYGMLYYVIAISKEMNDTV